MPKLLIYLFARWLSVIAIVATAACTQPNPSHSDSRRNAGNDILAATRLSASADPLAALKLHATTGAAAGYVEDHGCAICHREKSESYQGVGMAQSLRRPPNALRIEDFDRSQFRHEPSQEHYAMRWENGTLTFHRWQLDTRGQRIHAIAQRVDFVLGSGHRARVYLYRTPSGELFQLPIAWYAQERTWRMAPGFDRADHQGITRRVRRECLFCHNAYPQVAAGSDAHAAPQVFPAELPEGTGCQRCHGPGAVHIRTALGGGSVEVIRAAIVNPRRLPAERRDAVCFQCHLQPAVALSGVRRFGRADYSFRPGERLDAYLLHVDIDEPGRDRDDRFEINHHAYRLTQSPCYRQGGITCIDCHDPHQPLERDARLAAAGAVCQRCHQRHGPALTPPGKSASVAAGECVGCHMPRRRTQDVVHVVMTDHRIQRVPRGKDLLAPLAEADETKIDDVRLLESENAPQGALADIYRAVTALRVGAGGTPALERLRSALLEIKIEASEPWLDLAAAQLQRRRFGEAEATFDFLIRRNPARDPQLVGWRGLARIGAGKTAAGIEDVRHAAAAVPDAAEFEFKLGLILRDSERNEEALAAFSRTLALRPNLASGWVARGMTLAALDRRVAAIADLRQALAIDPRETRAYLALVPLLRSTGESAEAERFLAHGLRVAENPGLLAPRLAVPR